MPYSDITAPLLDGLKNGALVSKKQRNGSEQVGEFIVDNRDEIEALIGNRICGVCEQKPQLVTVKNDWKNGNIIYGMRCECGVDQAILSKPSSYADHRKAGMDAAADKETEIVDIEGLF